MVCLSVTNKQTNKKAPLLGSFFGVRSVSSAAGPSSVGAGFGFVAGAGFSASGASSSASAGAARFGLEGFSRRFFVFFFDQLGIEFFDVVEDVNESSVCVVDVEAYERAFGVVVAEVEEIELECDAAFVGIGIDFPSGEGALELEGGHGACVG